MFKDDGPNHSRLLSCEIMCSLLNLLLHGAKLKWQCGAVMYNANGDTGYRAAGESEPVFKN